MWSKYIEWMLSFTEKKRLQKDISKAQHEQILTVFTYLE